MIEIYEFFKASSSLWLCGSEKRAGARRATAVGIGSKVSCWVCSILKFIDLVFVNRYMFLSKQHRTWFLSVKQHLKTIAYTGLVPLSPVGAFETAVKPTEDIRSMHVCSLLDRLSELLKICVGIARLSCIISCVMQFHRNHTCSCTLCLHR